MSGLRHNPYVGSFHGKNFQTHDGTAPTQLIIEDSKSNPLVGVFRHSPSLPSKSLGLKSILYGGMTRPPIFSQLQVARESKKLPPHNFLRSLRQIPTKVYSASSVGSRSERSCTSPEGQPEEDEHLPTCSICLDPYADGDELRTFACSHCFHNECVSKWIFHRCLDNEELDSFNCPECRQNHITLSEAGSSRTSLAEGISSLSFLQVGENMAREGGYDFLSDFGSDLQSPAPRSMPNSPRPFRTASGGSGGSDSEHSPRSAHHPEVEIMGSNFGGPILTPNVERDGIATARGPQQLSPRRPVVVLNPNFGSRLSGLHRSSNRLLGIFPVPEESSYCVNDSAFHSAAGDASSSSAPSPTLGIAAGESLFGASALLTQSSLSMSTTSTTTSTTATSAGASTPSRTSARRVPPVAQPAWATQDPLCASEYSDCGLPLSRM